MQLIRWVINLSIVCSPVYSGGSVLSRLVLNLKNLVLERSELVFIPKQILVLILVGGVHRVDASSAHSRNDLLLNLQLAPPDLNFLDWRLLTNINLLNDYLVWALILLHWRCPLMIPHFVSAAFHLRLYLVFLVGQIRVL